MNKGQGGVRLSVCKTIYRTAARSREFISDMLLEMSLESYGQARALTFVVTYALTHTRSVGKTRAFWIALDRVVKEVPEPEQLFVLWTQTRGRDGGKGGSGGVRSVKFSVPTAGYSQR